MILCNESKGTYFLFNPKAGRFLHENSRIAFWAEYALGWQTLNFDDIDAINQFRKTIEGMDFTGMTPVQMLQAIQDAHPELFL